MISQLTILGPFYNKQLKNQVRVPINIFQNARNIKQNLTIFTFLKILVQSQSVFPEKTPQNNRFWPQCIVLRA